MLAQRSLSWCPDAEQYVQDDVESHLTLMKGRWSRYPARLLQGVLLPVLTCSPPQLATRRQCATSIVLAGPKGFHFRLRCYAETSDGVEGAGSTGRYVVKAHPLCFPLTFIGIPIIISRLGHNIYRSSDCAASSPLRASDLRMRSELQL